MKDLVNNYRDITYRILRSYSIGLNTVTVTDNIKQLPDIVTSKLIRDERLYCINHSAPRYNFYIKD